MQLMELMTLCTTLSDMVLDLKNRRNDQDERISFVQEDAETHGRYGHDIEVNTASTSITTASINLTAAKPVTTVSAPVTTAGVSEASETASRPIVPPQQQLDPKDKGKGIMQEPEKPVKVKGKDQIALDEEVARRLKAQIQAEFKEERVTRQREEEANLIS
nr:hypothetical protein [Tanacetum cinerariifolium]